MRFRVHSSELIGRPDLVFARSRVVLFVDGDFWHGRAVRLHGSRAYRWLFRSSNRAFWVKKIRENIRRDDLVTRMLREEGWRVIRLWESSVLRDPALAAARVASVIRSRLP